MRAVSLSSGSKGNCTFIETPQTKVLVDNGLTLVGIEARLNSIGVSGQEIDAILLTHEHGDHLYGIKAFLRKYKKTKVYIPAFVQNYAISSICALPQSQIEWFVSSDFFIKDLTISSFILPHDSKFCVGYSFINEGKKISVATDLGFVSNQTLGKLSASDILFLESNHDETLLQKNPKYTARLKKRIMSNSGHLSNVACGKALIPLVRSGVKQVILSHLSEENNTPLLAYNTIKQVLAADGIIEGDHVCVDVAFQDRIGNIFNL